MEFLSNVTEENRFVYLLQNFNEYYSKSIDSFNIISETSHIIN